MKKLLGLFGKHHAKGGIIYTTNGITADDWNTLYNALRNEYDSNAKQHKKPTEYMRGIRFAITVMETCQPHEITCKAEEA